jgi:hypothetical protein
MNTQKLVIASQWFFFAACLWWLAAQPALGQELPKPIEPRPSLRGLTLSADPLMPAYGWSEPGRPAGLVLYQFDFSRGTHNRLLKIARVILEDVQLGGVGNTKIKLRLSLR